MSIPEDPEDPEPLDLTFDSEKKKFPIGIMKILQKYTTWETREDVSKVAHKHRFRLEKFDIKDLEGELEIMKGLYSDLKEYDPECKKSRHDLVEIAKRRVFDKFPDIQNMEKYSQLADEYWVEAILQERTVNDTDDDDGYYCDCSGGRLRLRLATVAYGGALYRSCSYPVVETDEDVELRLSELYEELGTDRSKVREAHDLWWTLGVVYRTVDSIIDEIKEQVEHLRNQMSRREHRNKEERRQKEWEEEREEARKLKKEKLQCLCNVMKEVLGDRVEDVVVSSESPCHPSYRANSCYLRDSGMGGGKTMEIIPGDCIIEDLRKRSDADKNDIHVRNSTLFLFQYADLHWKTRQQEQ